MSLDDLLKGLSVFNDGLKQYAVARGVNDANEKLAQLNSEEMDRAQQLQAQNQISSELGMRLTAAGADAATIGAAQQGIAPSLGAQFQAEENRTLQDEANKFKAGESELERAHQIKLKQLELAAAKAKLDKKFDEKQVGFLQKYQEQFAKDSKNATDALEQVVLAEDTIESGNPIGDQAIVNFMARASGEKGPLTETDKEPFGGSSAYTSKVQRVAKRAKDGKLIESDRTFIKQLIKTYKVAQYRNIMADRDKIAMRAERTATVGGYGLSKDDIAGTLYEVPEDMVKEIKARDEARAKGAKKTASGSAAPAPQQDAAEKIAALEAYLASPMAKKNPQKAMQVEAAIRKLKAGQ